MDKFKLDALFAPTGGPAWLTDLIDGDHGVGREFQRSRRRGISQYQRHCRISLWLARRRLFLRTRMERAHSTENRIRFRTAYQARQKPMFLPTIPLGA